ncbi:hypothetical protein A6768_07630 [Sphingobium yanoikuyae]|uniref:Uncharacterized protein n=1 Tax=Sphingobium yanoikuyae TaxID=13690 RepID=A0A291MXU5_SPHYA|nr:hypothetical protein A6768_07630 [Sphingobium yanoikuyae]
MDVLIDAHCHFIRSTRALAAWGTTLNVAVHYLATLPADEVTVALSAVPSSGLIGDQYHFLGAPASMNQRAAKIIKSAMNATEDRALPELRHVYILALQVLLAAEASSISKVYREIIL